MKYTLKLFSLLFILCLGFLCQPARAQLDNDYFSADQLLRQQKYEQAYEKFYRLHQQNPSTYIYFSKATECLIQLKRYEKAIGITQKAMTDGHYNAQAMVRLGEIYHISGDTEKAHSTWDSVMEKYAGNQQVTLRVARTMSDRHVFDRAITIYKKLQQNYSTSNMVSSELAGTYLQAGHYEKAIQEYLQLVKQSPERMNFVQQRFIRYRDDNIYDVAILEISDFLDELSPTHPSYRKLQQLEVWLLMERELFQRALMTAKNYEAQSSDLTYLLYNIGPKLLSAQKFELAEQAYNYYIDNNIYSVKFRSMEKLAEVYRAWAQYLENYNLGLSSKRDTLYQQAFETLKAIWDQNPNYQRLNKVLVAMSELALDVQHQPKTASNYLDELRKLSDASLSSQINYIEGRLHLYNQDYTRARVAFTKSNKQENSGALAEKTRYYLALTDFYAGDYEFAKIQLNALERQNTSYYANDAVQLRLWIQNGLQADSSGTQLDPFAKAVEYFSQGKDQLGSNKLQDLFDQGAYHPLVDDAILEMSTHKTSENVMTIYQALVSYLDQSGKTSPLQERLLWEKARIADQFVTNENVRFSLSNNNADSLSAEQQFFNRSKQQGRPPIPTNTEELITIYEDILMNYPNGFYASYVRSRINELQDIQT